MVVALSVRTAFDALLSELALPAASEVLMSAVNIAHMADIVRVHELVPVAVDIEIETLAPSPETLERAIGPASRVFVLAQLFGARTDVEPYATVCARHGLLLIEDAAQAFAGRLDLPAGADVSLYSFGPIKTSTALGGGLALVRDADLASRLKQRLACYRPLSEGWFRRRVLKYACFKALSHPISYAVVVTVISMMGRDPDHAIGSLVRGFRSGNLLARLRRSPPRSMVRLLARRIKSAAGPTKRRDRGRRVISTLPRTVAVPGMAAQDHGFWLIAILTPDPSQVVRRLRSSGFDATQGATSMRALGGAKLAAPNAERLIETVVYLPVTGWLQDQELDRLAKAVAQATSPEKLKRMKAG